MTRKTTAYEVEMMRLEAEGRIRRVQIWVEQEMRRAARDFSAARMHELWVASRPPLRPRWRCWFGFHVWKQDKPLTIYDGWPAPDDSSYETAVRRCDRCGRIEKWLPGYGGSEWGCWLEER